MNIILLTVLLTLLGTGLVILLVWLSIVSCKSIKFRKKAKIKFEDLSKNLEDTTHSIYSSIEERTIDANNNTNDLHNLRDQDLQIESNNLQDLRNYTVERFKELERSIDSRLDKIHNLLKEK